MKGEMLVPDCLYATSSADHTVLAFVIADDGVLKPHPETPSLPAGRNPQFIAVHPSKRLLCTSNYLDASLSAYALARNGAMAELRKVPLEAGSRPVHLAFTPVSGNLFVARGAVDGLAVDIATGEASILPGSPYATGQSYVHLAVLPDGGTVYVAGGRVIGAFGLEPSGGLLPLAGFPVTLPASVVSFTVHPAGRLVYVGAGPAIYWYRIDASTGGLTLGGSVPAVDYPIAAAFTPRGDFLYVGSSTTTEMAGFQVAADGSLTPVPGAKHVLPDSPLMACVDPSGAYLYFSLPRLKTVAGYSIGHNGALKGLPGAPFRVAVPTAGLAVVRY
jgi:6-phosphogluconolactonase